MFGFHDQKKKKKNSNHFLKASREEDKTWTAKLKILPFSIKGEKEKHFLQ
jgi:hypothetical protein